MIKYIITGVKADCCGCRACEQICTRNAIAMKPDEEGFLYPILDKKSCIDCGKCSKVCPMQYDFEKKSPCKTYAAQIKDDVILHTSSSGGMFRLFADYVIGNGGLVVGCVWDEQMNAIMRIAYNRSDLEKMQGSKYVSSDTRDVFLQTRLMLDAGRTVLFSASPCQSAGLISFLGKDYDNLITMDFLCHGMPSAKIFNLSLKHLESKYQIKICDYKFRDKSKYGWGIVTSIKGKGKRGDRTIVQKGITNPYIYGFTKGLYNRYSCYQCPFVGSTRIADITIADYWGIQKYHSEFKNEDGVSILLINSKKAQIILESLEEGFICVDSDVNKMSTTNSDLAISKRNDEITTKRKDVYEKIENEGWGKFVRQNLLPKDYLIRKLYYWIQYILKKK